MDFTLPKESGSRQGRAIPAVYTLIVASCMVTATLAPRPGAATLYIPLSGLIPGKALPVVSPARPGLGWAIAHGARIGGTGPAGSVVLVDADPALALHALSDRAIAIAVPLSLCQQPEN